jgi:hypothetical protein
MLALVLGVAAAMLAFVLGVAAAMLAFVPGVAAATRRSCPMPPQLRRPIRFSRRPTPPCATARTARNPERTGPRHPAGTAALGQSVPMSIDSRSGWAASARTAGGPVTPAGPPTQKVSAAPGT